MLCRMQVMTSPNSDVAFNLTWVALKNRQSYDLAISLFKTFCKTTAESINLGVTVLNTIIKPTTQKITILGVDEL